MEYRVLGRTGLRVSALGFGCGSVGGLFVRGEPADQLRAFERALSAGITYFDTAPSYGDGRSETNVGRVWREVRPPNAHLGTKVNLTRAELADAPGAIRRSIEASLARLGFDSVDLLQLHNRIVAGPETGERGVTVAEALGPIAEGLRAVQAAGLTRHIGFTGLGDSAAVGEVARSGLFDSVQSYYNVLNSSAGRNPAGAARGGATQDFGGLIEQAAGAGLGVIVIRMLAAGAVSAAAERHPLAHDPGGTLATGNDYARDLERARRLLPLVAEFGLDGPVELAVRFVLANPEVSTALTGVSDLDQLDSILGWAERGPLTPDQVRRCVAAVAG